jgi:hypothetical protein
MSQTKMDEAARTGLSRRSVLRVGANAAWAIPAVTVVTAAPAFAASTPAKAVLHVVGYTIARNTASGAITGSLTVSNTGTAPTVGATTVTIQIPKGSPPLDKAPTPPTVGSSAGSGWVFSSSNTAGNTGPWTYTWTYSLTITPNQSSTVLNVSLTGSSGGTPKSGGVSTTATAQSTGGTAGGASDTLN